LIFGASGAKEAGDELLYIPYKLNKLNGLDLLNEILETGLGGMSRSDAGKPRFLFLSIIRQEAVEKESSFEISLLKA
jgi:hypothetical protein